jgi:hypothetical protein
MSGGVLRPAALALMAAWLTLVAPPALPATAQLATAQSATAPPLGWPHTINADGATAIVYQPQAMAWPDHKTLTARAAVAITPQGQHQPILGSIELSLATRTNDSTGLVALSDPTLLSSHFPSLDTQQAAALEARLRAALGQRQIQPVPLQSILLSLNQLPAANVSVNNDPPAIFYASKPASLVVFDGEPVLAPVRNTTLSFAVNTNWDVFVSDKTWYLLNNGAWFSAPAATGPFVPVSRLPAAFNALPNDASFGAARSHVPAKAPSGPVPTIFVSTAPAEIVVTDGAPQFALIAGTGLQRVSNTPSTLIFDPEEKRFYLLASGRWFAAADLNGPWQFASDKLPPDFALIPADGPEAVVLAAVPGTVQAQEAVLKAQIPTTASLQRGSAKPTVAYSGPPHFVPIPGTQVQYAVNTNAQVLKIGAKYYACDKAAWFVATTPTGPWVLADSLPPEIRTIPPTSPMYNVTYVQVYGATTATVTYGYTAGYMMGFVSSGVLVYGTGYYYPPVVVPGPVPIFYPYPYTYASNVWYNPSTGAWARGGTVYGPYGGAATGGRYYNPSTGAWAQGGAIYGPNGGAGAWSYYNPQTGSYAHGSAAWGNGSGTANASFYNARTGISGSTNQNVNPYSRWGSSTVSGPNQTVNTQSRGNAQGAAGSFSSTSGAEGAGYHNRVTGNSGGAAKGANGDVYAGRDGNVYRHDDDGWSKWGSGGWNPVQPPTNNRNGGNSGNLGGTQSSAAPAAARSNGAPGTSAGGATASRSAAAPHSTGAAATARGGGSYSTMDRGSYQQLEQDRLGRQAGSGRFAGGGSRFGGGGGGYSGVGGGGGRFRR